MHPSLEIARAGLKHHTGSESMGSHVFDNGWVGVIQIDEDVTRIASITEFPGAPALVLRWSRIKLGDPGSILYHPGLPGAHDRHMA
jgi:hypothetical protein